MREIIKHAAIKICKIFSPLSLSRETNLVILECEEFQVPWNKNHRHIFAIGFCHKFWFIKKYSLAIVCKMYILVTHFLPLLFYCDSHIVHMWQWLNSQYIIIHNKRIFHWKSELFAHYTFIHHIQAIGYGEKSWRIYSTCTRLRRKEKNCNTKSKVSPHSLSLPKLQVFFVVVVVAFKFLYT